MKNQVKKPGSDVAFGFDPNDHQEFKDTIELLGKGPANPSPVEVEVRVLASVITTEDEKTYYPAITVHDPLECYLVPTDSFTPNPRESIKLIDPKDKFVQAYDWAAELEQMVPDVETVRRNILVSFWRAGAFDRAKANKNSVRSAMFNSAFPYRLEESQ